MAMSLVWEQGTRAAMAAAAHKSLQDFFMAQLSFLENSSGEKNEIISLICQN